MENASLIWEFVKNFDAHEIIALVIIFASFYIAIIKKFNPKFIEIDKKLDKIDLRFDKIDAKFDKIDQRFEKMDQRFEKIDQRFEKTDHRFEKIEKDIMELKSSSQTQYFDLKGDLMQIEKLLHKKNGCKLINSENDKETG